MKKIISILMALSCLLSSTAAAFAEGTDTLEGSTIIEIPQDAIEPQKSAEPEEQQKEPEAPETLKPENDTAVQDTQKPEEKPAETAKPETPEKPENNEAYISQSRAVIGANLDEQQIAAVYNTFGIKRGDVIELKLNNSEEREYLEGYVDPGKIGTRSISCVYVELLDKGKGMDVTTSNINWVTAEMYISALATAGITDAKIVVASPFEVSGTAALAGVYKAYEDMTGQELNQLAKAVSTQELTITASLADEIGSMDSMAIVNELKLMLDETRLMSDEEIKYEINEITGRYNVKLNDKQLDMLLGLCRSLEGLDGDALKQRVEEAQDTLKKLSGAKTKVVGFVETAKKVVESIKSFFRRIGDIIGI